MKIMNVNNTQNSRPQNPSFGMKLSIDADAAKILSKWTTDVEFKKLVPEIEAIKTKNNKDILVEIAGDLKEKILNFVGFAEKQEVNNIKMSPGHSTFQKKDLGNNIFDDFMPTLKGIMDDLNFKIEIEENRAKTEQYLMENFGKNRPPKA